MPQDMKAVMDIHSLGSIGSCPLGSRELRGQRVSGRDHGQYLHKISSLNNDIITRRYSYYSFLPHMRKGNTCKVSMM